MPPVARRLFRFSPRCLPWTLAFVAGFAQAAGQSMGPADVDVPAQPLTQALLDIGRSYGVIISFNPQLVNEKTAPSVRGHYLLEQALSIALRDSGLQAQIMADGTVTMHPATPPADAGGLPPAAPESPAPPSPSPSPAASSAVGTQRVVVWGDLDIDPGYGLRRHTDAATLIDTPSSQIPQAVSVVTKDVIDMTGARSVNDALDYVTGVSVQGLSQSSLDVPVKVRGLPAQFAVGGMPSLQGLMFPIEGSLVDGIEVLKGPAGVVGGIADFGGRGGIVDVTLKQPHAGDRTALSLRLDQDDGASAVESDFDVNRGDATLAWRVAGDVTRSTRGNDGYDGRTGQSAEVAVTGRVGDVGMSATLIHEQRRNPPPPRTQLKLDDTEADTMMLSAAGSLDRAAAPEDGERLRLDSVEVESHWNLSEHWQIEARSRWEVGQISVQEHNYETYNDSVGALSLAATDVGVRLSAQRLLLRGEFATGPLGHRLLLGADRTQQSAYESFASAGWYLDPAAYVPGSALGAPDSGSTALADPWQSVPQRLRQHGYMLQDQISWGDLHVRLGARKGFFAENNGDVVGRVLKGANWDAGAAYDLTPTLTVYAGAQSALEAAYRDPGAVLPDGMPAPLTRVRQYQAGVKMDFLDRRMTLSAEVYRLREQDVLYDELIGGNDVNVLVPGQSSQGFELELSGSPLRRLELTFGLSLLSARATEGGVDQPGPMIVPATAAPSRSTYLLARYRLPEAWAGATRIGAGMRARAAEWDVQPDPEGLAPSYRVAGGALFDLFGNHDAGPWRFSAILHNVFDRRMYGPDLDTTFLTMTQRRSLTLVASYEL